MSFSKSFPRTSKTSPYPQWEEIFLTEDEERAEEEKCRNENKKLMGKCIDDAKNIINEKEFKDYQTVLIRIAIALFEKRASHSVYWKESKAKDKFDEKIKE